MLIAIDQGEELFAAEDAAESERFIAMLGNLLAHPPEGLDPLALMTIRADSVDPLLQRVPKLGIDAPHMRPLPPLSVSAYRDVITKPAAVYARRVARLDVEPELVELLVEKSTGKDALPLLAFTLQRMFDLYHKEQRLTVADYGAMGGIEGSIDRALVEAQKIASAAGSQDNLRRLLIPGLATWDPAANAAKRIVSLETDLLSGDRASLAPLANALVQTRLLTRGPGTLEVAHEALLRRPTIDGWLQDQKDALKLRDDVLKEANEWTVADKPDKDLVRRGARLEAALALHKNTDYASALSPANDYLAACQKLEQAGLRRTRRTQRAMTTLMAGTIALLLGIIFKTEIEQVVFDQTTVRNFIASQVRPLSAEAERAVKPGTAFKECLKNCPDMVVVPAGSFLMGSPDGEKGRYNSEGPVHPVTIAKPFAVAKFTVTWDEWEVCVAMRGCDGRPTGPADFGKGSRPVINITWDQANAYATWLSRMTGKPYRLLTEAEWEYAARGVTSREAPHPAYPWGDSDICKHANLADKSFAGRYTGEAVGCDDKWANTAPVGSFPANAFGLYDMHGNVWQWVQDSWHDDYSGDPPADGTEWIKDADTSRRVVRGGSWIDNPQNLRSAFRGWLTTLNRNNNLGFRVGRTLNP